MYTDLALYIDGEWLKDGGRESEQVINPATEKPLATLTHAGTADLDRALEAAQQGYKLWRATAPYERARMWRIRSSSLTQSGPGSYSSTT